MLFFLSLVDVVVVSPAAFSLGVIVGYVIRAKFNGKGDKDE